MRTHVAALASVAIALSMTAAGADQASERHAIVTVVDKRDAPLGDIQASEITVREDGAVQQVLRVEPAKTPMRIALLADDSQIAQPMLVELRESLVAFVQAMGQQPRTEFSLWTFGGLARKQINFTTNTVTIEGGIGALFSRPGAGSYLMETLLTASNDLGLREGARPVIVAQLLDDAPELSTATENTVTTALKRAGVSLWTIVVEGNREGEAAPAERRDRTTVTTDAATASGGGTTTIVDRLELRDAYRSIAARLMSALDVTYVRTSSTKPPTKLDVKVKRSGARVFASNWAPR